MGTWSPPRLLKATGSRKQGLQPSEKVTRSWKEVLRPHVFQVPVKTLALEFLSKSEPFGHVLPHCRLLGVAVHPVEEALVLVHPRQRQSRQVGVQDGADTSVPGERVGARLAEHVADLVSN